MSFEGTVRDAFAAGGVLSNSIDGFQSRQGQTEMAAAVARTMDAGGVLVVEAGTGIGKTFSYLVPALLSGARILLSTATKTLQDQLFGRDLPCLIKAMGLPVRSALLKGRGSYLCLYRLAEARQHLQPQGQVAYDLARVELWAQVTTSGDLAEVMGLDERSPLIPWVTSTRDNCLGSNCPQYRSCHLNKARQTALVADLVVINHHLFFADLAIRESGMAELLPTVRTVIFDEAHQLNEIGMQFLGQQLSTGQLLDFARDLLSVGLVHARGLADWQSLAASTERGARDLRLTTDHAPNGSKLRWVDAAPDTLDLASWNKALDAMHAACTRAVAALDSVSGITPDLARLAERGSELIEGLERFSIACAPDSVRWLEVGMQLRLMQTELDIGNAFQRKVFKSAHDGDESLQRSWVFTSATLGSDAGLTWFTEPCGLGGAEILKVGSPFDYSKQAVVYVPPHLPKPKDPNHSAKVAEFVGEFAPLIGGRTLVLTTSLRAMRTIGEWLQKYFSESKALEILVQGQLPKRELIERFRDGHREGNVGCVLLASASFWEGVDIPGEALQMVVIDKLPFPSPDDPLVEARSKRLDAAKRSVFNHYFMPEAAIALKQGAGRLIRHESDRGILVVCDTRLTDMGYGRRLLGGLPPMRRIGSDEELTQALLELTKTSTRDSNPI